MAKLKYLLASLLVISATLLSASGVSASTIVQKQEVPKNLQVIQTATNNYSVQVGANVISLGSATSSFTPAMTFPDWQGYAWNAQLGLTMAVPGNALAMAGMTSSSTSTSVTASNSYFSITYSGVAVNPPFNETGGLDMSINILKNIGTTLAFGYNKTEVNAYVQPPLTDEWTVGQTLPNGNTVASVTATDVTDNQGNNVAHRPIYVVGSIALYNATAGGMVTSAQAATGLTDGEMGMMYALTCHDSSATPQTGYATWSISGSNFILTLPTFVNPVYPIVLAPAGDTFGYTTVGSTSGEYYIGASSIYFQGSGYAGESAIGNSISLYTEISQSYGTNGVAKMALYTNSDSTYSLATNGSTNATGNLNSYDSGNTPNPAWATASFASSPTLTSTTYYLMQLSNTFCDAYFNTGSHDTYVTIFTQSYPSWSSFSSPSDEPNQWLISIYCTCTPVTNPATMPEGILSVLIPLEMVVIAIGVVLIKGQAVIASGEGGGGSPILAVGVVAIFAILMFLIILAMMRAFP